MPDAASQTSLRWPVLLVVLLGLSAAYFTWYYAARDEAEEASEAFRRLGVAHAERLEDFMHARASVLAGLAASIARDPDVDPELLRAMVGRAEEASWHGGPVLRYVAWAPRVVDAELAAYVAARQELDPGFRVRRLDGAEARPGYPHVVVDTLWPASFEARLVGLDLASDPARRQTLDAALSGVSAGATLSGQVELAEPRPDENRMGVMLCVPVYPTDVALGSDDQRHDALLGYVVAECSLQVIMEAAFSRELPCSRLRRPCTRLSSWAARGVSRPGPRRSANRRCPSWRPALPRCCPPPCCS
jgi:CHASE1-domain containing sensor protein